MSGCEIFRVPSVKQRKLIDKTKLLEFQIDDNRCDVKEIDNEIDRLSKRQRKSRSESCASGLQQPIEKVIDRCEPEDITTCCYRICEAKHPTPDMIVHLLQQRLEKINSEIFDYRDQNQMLKKEILFAKKVMRREVGGDSVSYETLLTETRDIGWKGREETVIGLRDKIHELRSRTTQMTRGRLSTPEARSQGRCVSLCGRPKRSNSADSISEDRRNYWRLELERRHVLQKAERDLNALQSERRELNQRLNASRFKNLALIDEVRIMREKLRSLIEQNVEDSQLIHSLHTVENHLKESLDERRELRQVIDGVKRNNGRHVTTATNLRNQIELLQKTSKADALLRETLEGQTDRLRDLLDVERMKNHQEGEQFNRSLDDVAGGYSQNLEAFRELETGITAERGRIIDLMPDALKDELFPLDGICMTEKEATSTVGVSDTTAVEVSPSSGGFDPVIEMDPNSTIEDLKAERDRGETLYRTALTETRRMTELVFVIIETLQDRTQQLMSDKRNIFAKKFNEQLLKEHIKKLQKEIGNSAKDKNTALKKKHHLPQDEHVLMEQLEIRFNILAKENAFLLGALNAVLANQENDFELCKAFIENNKDNFLKTVIATNEPDIEPKDNVEG